MTHDAYGNLGNEMKAMKNGRAALRARVKQNHEAIRRQAGQVRADAAASLGQTARANRQQAAQTRQMLDRAGKDSKARAARTLAEADTLVAAIRKDVAALKADAARILAGAGGFLAETGQANSRLRVQTRRMLAQSRAACTARTQEALAEAGKVMVRTRTAVAGIKSGTGRVLADAAGVLKRLSEASRQRAAAWRSILHGLHGDTAVAGAPRAKAAETPANKSGKRNARPKGQAGK